MQERFCNIYDVKNKLAVSHTFNSKNNYANISHECEAEIANNQKGLFSE